LAARALNGNQQPVIGASRCLRKRLRDLQLTRRKIKDAIDA
jgi:hypothetical protein